MWIFATLSIFNDIFLVIWSEFHDKPCPNMIESRQILYTLQVTIMSSKGFIYALIYCRYNKINEQFQKVFGKLCCKKQSNEITETMNSLI
jgi:hypothetical protein